MCGSILLPYTVFLVILFPYTVFLGRVREGCSAPRIYLGTPPHPLESEARAPWKHNPGIGLPLEPPKSYKI